MTINSTELSKLCPPLPDGEPHWIKSLRRAGQISPVVAVSSQVTAARFREICLTLAASWYERVPKCNVVWIDLNQADSAQTADPTQLFKDVKLAESGANTVLISGCERFGGTEAWARQILRAAKKLHVHFYLFFDDVGFLFSALYKQLHIPHFWLRAPEYSLRTSLIADVIGINPQEIINKQSSEEKLTAATESLSQRLISVLRHDAYDVYGKRFSVHTCLDLLAAAAYAQVPLFDTAKLAADLGISATDCYQLLKILDTAKILRYIKIVDRDLKPTLPGLAYLVLFNPADYVAFPNATGRISEDLRIRVAHMTHEWQPNGQVKLVLDPYVEFVEQTTLYSSTTDAAFQIGVGSTSVGPLLNYLRNVGVKKCAWLDFSHLLTFASACRQKFGAITRIS